MADKTKYEELEERIKELEKENLESKRIVEELRESKHYYRSLVNHIHEDILVIDLNYRITDVNKTFLIATGRTREEIIGKYCYEISHGYNAPCEDHGEECMLSKVIETGKPQSFWHQHLHTEGWKVWVDILMSPLTNENGEITHVIEAIRDVTELVKTGKDPRKSE